MKVLIEGTGSYNKGAELLLLSILESFKEDSSGIKNEFYFGRGIITKKRLKELGIRMHNTPKNLLLFFYNLPFVKVPQKYHVDVVLDASGFRYGDFWVKNRTIYFNIKEFLKYRFFKKTNARIIFLPQAFGAFTKLRSKWSAKTIVKFADLIIARDKQSYDFLNKFIKNSDTPLHLYPDFTNLLSAPDSLSSESGICVIPNSKIFEKYSEKESQIYVDFLIHSIRFFLEKKKKVYILNHSSKDDLSLCKMIINIINNDEVELVNLEDPIAIKGFIKQSEFVIASRFHGIISSLSQGIPTVCIGWSHKYEYLMFDYKQSDAIIKISSSKEMMRILQVIYNDGNLSERREVIEKSAEQIKSKAIEMWEIVKEKSKLQTT